MISEFQGKFRFLSNFWPCCIVMNGAPYSTLEHAYQASKTTNAIIRERIRRAPTPGKAKQMGGDSWILRSDWEDVKVEIMISLLREKFNPKRNLELSKLLLETGNQELVEGNKWHDNFWGICQCESCQKFKTGQNWLGKLLMQVRGELKNL
jgi:ribA/ribD-fused uncharacterized protein